MPSSDHFIISPATPQLKIRYRRCGVASGREKIIWRRHCFAAGGESQDPIQGEKKENVNQGSWTKARADATCFVDEQILIAMRD